MDVFIELVKFFSALLVSLISTIVWPLVIGLIIYTFRADISEFTSKVIIRRLELPGGTKVEFGNNQEREPAELEINNKEEVNNLVKLLNDKDTDARKQKDRAEIAEIKLHFEFVHNYIFSSQYTLLKLMSESVNSSLSIETVGEYYAGTPLKEDPNWNVTKYLNFLIKTGLVEVNSDLGVTITELGIYYLRYTKDVPMAFLTL